MKSSANLRKKMETGKQTGVAVSAGPCRNARAFREVFCSRLALVSLLSAQLRQKDSYIHE
jgi:hypothetical protein